MHKHERMWPQMEYLYQKHERSKNLCKKSKGAKNFWEMSNLKLLSWIEFFGRNPILQKISPIKSMKKSQWARLSKTTMWPYFSVTIILKTYRRGQSLFVIPSKFYNRWGEKTLQNLWFRNFHCRSDNFRSNFSSKKQTKNICPKLLIL